MEDLDVTYAPGLTVKKSVLSKAFDEVADPNDWKGPISALIAFDNPHLQFVLIAVEFFTATEATAKAEGDKLRITAKGYRMGPAGDH